MKKIQSMSIVLALFLGLFMLGISSTEAKEAAPKAEMWKMMPEHVGMDCRICHGENGPKDVKMGNHPGQKCTDCHDVKTKKIKEAKETVTKTPLANKMMLEHEGMDCKTCHGEKGPKGMTEKVKSMMKHQTLDCKKCHIVETK
ncbi:MAG: hypothetical protein HQK89_00375 [Nitrospirae bacterium]|nr:hypothetical protein [Nitrospirota bacterium]